MHLAPPADHPFAKYLEDVRRSGRPFLDLVDADPATCGLAVESIAEQDPKGEEAWTSGEGEAARVAVARYVASRGLAAGAENVLVTASPEEAYDLLFASLCAPGDEVLAPSPSAVLCGPAAARARLRVTPYTLRYDGSWHVDHRSLAAALTPRTRAVIVQSPSIPAGGLLSAHDLGALDDFCAGHGLALVADERFADAVQPMPPCAAATWRSLAFGLFEARTVSGLPGLDAGWLVGTGPEKRVRDAMARLRELATGRRAPPTSSLRALPRALERRDSFLIPLRDRLNRNRSTLARAAVGEAPWTILNGGGSWWGVLALGRAVREEALCRALLDEGLLVYPGSFYGFMETHLVVSLLLQPGRLRQGLDLLEATLRESPPI